MAGQADSQQNTHNSLFFTGVDFSSRQEHEQLPTSEFTATSSTALLFQAPDFEQAQKIRRSRAEKQEKQLDNDDYFWREDYSDDAADHDVDNADEVPNIGRKSRRGSRGGRKSFDDSSSTTRTHREKSSSRDSSLDDVDSNDAGRTSNTDSDDSAHNFSDNSDSGQTRRTSRRVNDAKTDGADDSGEETKKRVRKRSSTQHGDSRYSNDSQDSDHLVASGDDAEFNSSQRNTRSGSDQTHDSRADDDEPVTVVRRRRRRSNDAADLPDDGVVAPKGSTRLEAKRQRRREGREAGRRRHIITESEFLARRESVHREMLVRERDGLNQIAVIEDGVLVEHYVARHTQSSMVGNVYLGRVQNVLPSMEAAFVDIGKGRNAVLYAGEVNWEAAGLEGKPRRIEEALKSGDTVLVQVTKDPIGHKGARLTSQITLAGRHLVLVPSGAMTGISRKLPEKERIRLKRILREVVPAEHGVIVRTAAEGATEEQLRGDVERLVKAWIDIEAKSKSSKNAPSLLKGEPELAVRVVRDVFNEDFNYLRVQGDNSWETIHQYVHELSPELEDRLEHWTSEDDIFKAHRVDEQLAKAFDRKVFLPSGGTLVIDRTEAMTVIDVNTGKFTGSGGTLEETVTRNNLEAAEEIVRQLRLRDIGGIIVIDFIDMVLEANRELVLRRLVECLGRDRTRHQVAEVTSLGLVQMTRKRVGQGLVEAFSTECEVCEGRGYIAHDHPVEKGEHPDPDSVVNQEAPQTKLTKKQRREAAEAEKRQYHDPKQDEVKAAFANIAAAAHRHDVKPDAQSEQSDNRTSRNKRSTVTQEQPSMPSKIEDADEVKTAQVKAQASVTHSAPYLGDQTASEQSDGQAADVTNESNASAGSAVGRSVTSSTKKSVTKRVTSAGTIVPKSSSGSAIMTFPMKKA